MPRAQRRASDMAERDGDAILSPGQRRVGVRLQVKAWYWRRLELQPHDFGGQPVAGGGADRDRGAEGQPAAGRVAERGW